MHTDGTSTLRARLIEAGKFTHVACKQVVPDGTATELCAAAPGCVSTPP